MLKPDYGAESNKTLKVLDVSYNNFSGQAVQEFIPVFENNRTIEYLGLAKNNLTTSDVRPMLKVMGKDLFAPD